MSSILFLVPALMALGQTDVAGGEVLSSAEVRRAINQLADDSFDVRQHATDELWSMGESAVPALERALQGDDAEVRLRARSVLERFRFGIFVDTPAAIGAESGGREDSDASDKKSGPVADEVRQ